MEADETRQPPKHTNMFEGVPANYQWMLPTGLTFMDGLLVESLLYLHGLSR